MSSVQRQIRANLVRPLKEAAKSFAFRYTRLGAPSYPYKIEPIQLTFLVGELERLKTTAGNVLEIGVARGMTTAFLCQHIVNQGYDRALTFYAVDTFESFTAADVEHEVVARGKSADALMAFGYNDFDVWRGNFARFPFVKAIKGDCSGVDYAKLAPIKLALLDVDLYRPTILTLPKLYDALVDGGTIVVDDVRDNALYDGAYQAYMEFCRTRGLQPEFVGSKCGIIRKGA
jgi:predicted O-methyltransferase YrrM